MKTKNNPRPSSRPIGLRAEVEAITSRIRPASFERDRVRACNDLRDLVLDAPSPAIAAGRRNRVVSLLERFAGEDLADGLIATAGDLAGLARFVETIDERDARPSR